MSDESQRGLWAVLSTALVVRLAVVPLSVTKLNPYAQSDATRFAAAAELVARQLARGVLPAFNPNDVVLVWGTFLSPFWLLPGPSIWYAHVAVVLLGVGAVYNVYALMIRFGSYQAALLSSGVIAVLPSIVLVQASLLRDGAVMFGLTTVLRLWLAPSPELSFGKRISAATLVLSFTYLLRTENAPLYTLVAGAFVFFWILDHGGRLTSRSVGLSSVLTGGFAATLLLPRMVNYLATIRRKRAVGDSVYLSSVIPTSPVELLAFSWIGAVYFLFAPFPWMVTDIADLVVMWEGLLNLCFLIAGAFGVRRAMVTTGRPATVLALVAGFAAGIVLYGVANANFGTAARQRQMFLPVLYLFGAIGIAGRLKPLPTWGGSPSSSGPDEERPSH